MTRIPVVVFLALFCTACLKSTTVISLRPDGSGTIVQETGMSPQASAMLKSLSSQAADPKQAPAELFGEEQAKKTAAQMGVRFVSGEPIKTGEVEGYRARFAFDDVRKLQVKMSQSPAAGLSDAGGGSEPPFGFTFEPRGQGALLTIRMPEQKPGGPFALPGAGRGGAGADGQQNEQAIQMMKMMLQGLFVDVSLDIEGRILKTNAPYVQGSRLTLLQLDFDKLLTNESALAKLQSAVDLKSLGGINGLKLITDPVVTVEFAK
jgi:hypothetical protein